MFARRQSQKGLGRDEQDPVHVIRPDPVKAANEGGLEPLRGVQDIRDAGVYAHVARQS